MQSLDDIPSIEESREDIIGYAIGSKGMNIEILSKKLIDATRYPMLAIECANNTKLIVLIDQIEGRTIKTTRLYAIQDQKLIGNNIGIMPGYPATIISVDVLQKALEPESSTNVQPVRIPMGFMLGASESHPELDSKEMINLFTDRIKGKGDISPHEYIITLTPGELANGIMIGEAGSGKSNAIKNFITGVLINNAFGLGTKCGLVVFDKEDEYSSLFTKFADFPQFRDNVIIVKPFSNANARFPLHKVPIRYFVKESKSDNPEMIFLNILRNLYGEESESGVTPPPDYNDHPRRPGLSVSGLNYLLNLNGNESKQLAKATGYTESQIDAISRQLNKIDDYIPFLQIEYDEINGEYKEIAATNSLYTIISKAEEFGKIVIIDMSNFSSGTGYAVFVEYVDWLIEYLRKKRFSEILEQSGGDLPQFQRTVPMLLKINEEATMMFNDMQPSTLKTHIREATGARKYNMGTLYIFQSLEGVDSLIISQLGGFNIVLGISMDTNADKVIKNIHLMGRGSLRNFILNAKRFKHAVCSCEAYAQRPFFVHFYKAEDYIGYLLGISIGKLSRAEKIYTKNKEQQNGSQIIEFNSKTTSTNTLDEKFFDD